MSVAGALHPNIESFCTSMLSSRALLSLLVNSFSLMLLTKPWAFPNQSHWSCCCCCCCCWLVCEERVGPDWEMLPALCRTQDKRRAVEKWTWSASQVMGCCCRRSGRSCTSPSPPTWMAGLLLLPWMRRGWNNPCPCVTAVAGAPSPTWLSAMSLTMPICPATSPS